MGTVDIKSMQTTSAAMLVELYPRMLIQNKRTAMVLLNIKQQLSILQLSVRLISIANNSTGKAEDCLHTSVL